LVNNPGLLYLEVEVGQVLHIDGNRVARFCRQMSQFDAFEVGRSVLRHAFEFARLEQTSGAGFLRQPRGRRFMVEKNLRQPAAVVIAAADEEHALFRRHGGLTAHLLRF